MTFYTDTQIKMLAQTARKASDELGKEGFGTSGIRNELVLAIVKAQAEGMIADKVHRNARRA